MRQSSRMTSAVWLALTPILSSTLPAFQPGVPWSKSDAAVGRGMEGGSQADRVRFLDDVPRDGAFLVVLEGDGPHLAFRELVRRLLEEPLFIRQVELDHRPGPPLHGTMSPAIFNRSIDITAVCACSWPGPAASSAAGL